MDYREHGMVVLKYGRHGRVVLVAVLLLMAVIILLIIATIGMVSWSTTNTSITTPKG